MRVKYPEISVVLVGEDGNAINLIAIVCEALRKAGVGQKRIAEFTDQATSGDYDNVLTTCMRWVIVN